MRLIYSILMCFAAPVAAMHAWWRGRTNPSRRERIGDRFGRPQTAFSKPMLWVHAASMGEVQAGAALIRRLLQQYPGYEFVVTTQTVTGATRVKELFGAQVQHCYLPYDVFFAANAFFDRVQPRAWVILETELWPTLLRACRRRGIPVVVASGRISPRSFTRYKKLRSLFAPVLSRGVTVAAQTAADAERFKTLGATDVHAMGNIKFDIDIPAPVRNAGAAFRASQMGRFIWVAGSTHSGEEVAALNAHRRLLAAQPNALLILAPRHPQRFSAVEEILAQPSEQSTIKFVTRSSAAAVDTSVSVLLVDTMGELLNFYAAADVAFVGGSLAPVGGHNLLEPAALGVPVIAGPNLSNAQDVADRMAAAGATRIVKSTEGLGDALLAWAGDSAARSEAGQRGAAVVADNRGAVERVMALIAERL